MAVLVLEADLLAQRPESAKGSSSAHAQSYPPDSTGTNLSLLK